MRRSLTGVRRSLLDEGRESACPLTSRQRLVCMCPLPSSAWRGGAPREKPEWRGPSEQPAEARHGTLACRLASNSCRPPPVPTVLPAYGILLYTIKSRTEQESIGITSEAGYRNQYSEGQSVADAG
nr:hypothetical protein CFP56_16891 [Quercus suber]